MWIFGVRWNLWDLLVDPDSSSGLGRNNRTFSSTLTLVGVAFLLFVIGMTINEQWLLWRGTRTMGQVVNADLMRTTTGGKGSPRFEIEFVTLTGVTQRFKERNVSVAVGDRVEVVYYSRQPRSAHLVQALNRLNLPRLSLAAFGLVAFFLGIILKRLFKR